jgi:putative methyltransferase (TIGR04325 family)
MKNLLKACIPPALVPVARELFSRIAKTLHRDSLIDYEYLGEDWNAVSANASVRGWDVDEIVEAQESKWPRFLAMVRGTGPLGISHESEMNDDANVSNHNTIMTFAYVLLLAARGLDHFSILDWGGGLGHYYVIAEALLPDVNIEYHCKDLSKLAEHGSRLLPDQHFCSDDSCLERTYDLVMASSSMHYSRDWTTTLSQLAKASGGYLFVTRTPVVSRAPSFVFVQRPYSVQYNTEYLGWCLNRDEFLDQSRKLGLTLVREFVVAERPYIFRAPEQCYYRGFLFATKKGKEPTSEEHSP